MAEAYDSQGRKERRLDRSVCMYDGKPVYVRTVDPWRRDRLAADEVIVMSLEKAGELINKYDIPADAYTKIKYTEDKFSAASFPLGYYNGPLGADYLTRMPAKLGNAGLTMNHIRSERGGHSMFTKSMENCIIGEYPSLDEAIITVTNRVKVSCAFAREFAIGKLGRDILTLEFRGHTIGLWDATSKRFKLFPAKTNSLISSELKDLGVDHVVDTNH